MHLPDRGAPYTGTVKLYAASKGRKSGAKAWRSGHWNLEDREGATGSMNTTARNEGNVSRKGAKLKWWALGQEADWGMEEMRKLSNRQH